MKKFFAFLPLLLLCSCLSTHKTPPVYSPPVPDLNPYHAQLKDALPNLVVNPKLVFCTNTVHWQWIAPSDTGLTSYNFYFGTNSRTYFKPIQLGIDTNFFMTNIDQIISTNPYVAITTFADGTVVTNFDTIYVALTALYNIDVWQTRTGNTYSDSAPIINGIVESDYSLEAIWPPPLPPPWSAVVISWPPDRTVTLSVGDLNSPQTNRTVIPNPTGTNSMLLPLFSTNALFQGTTTDLPPVQLKIIGGYINGTN